MPAQPGAQITLSASHLYISLSHTASVKSSHQDGEQDERRDKEKKKERANREGGGGFTAEKWDESVTQVKEKVAQK